MRPFLYSANFFEVGVGAESSFTFQPSDNIAFKEISFSNLIDSEDVLINVECEGVSWTGGNYIPLSCFKWQGNRCILPSPFEVFANKAVTVRLKNSSSSSINLSVLFFGEVLE